MQPQPLTASRSTAESRACEIVSKRSSGSCRRKRVRTPASAGREAKAHEVRLIERLAGAVEVF